MHWHVIPATLRRVSRLAVPAAALLVGLASPLAAQSTGTIRGRVVETGSGRAVTDAQVTIAGTSIRAVTNSNGEFTIAAAPAGAQQVVVRRIGYARSTQSVTIASGATISTNFQLSQAASQLDVVVVTGTGGAVEKRTLGNSITTLDVAELTEKTSMANVTEVLQSKTPGVSILPGSGAPGTAGEIRIRGASSLSGYKPVVFIDGIRYNIDDLGGFNATGGGTVGLAQAGQATSALNNLNPNDIESIEVVKGPAAATLYGAEAANGVIQIITKKGTRGQQQLRWSFRAERGQSELRLLPQDNLTTCTAARQAELNTLGVIVWPGCQGIPVNTIIRDNPLARDPRAVRVGDLSKLSMNLRGGGDRYNFYIAGDRDVEQGVFFNSDNNRTSVRTNFGFNPNDKSDFQLSVNWQDGRLRLPIQDESTNGLILSAVRGQAGRISSLGVGNEGWRTISPTQANRYKNFTNSERLTLGATTTFTPWSWFQNRLTLGIDNTNVQAQLLFLPGDIDLAQDPDAASGANLRNNPYRRLFTIDYAGTLLWNPRPFLESTTKFGSQVISDKSESLRATGIGIGAVDVTLVNLLQRSTGGESFSENNSLGYYVQEQLGFRNRLYLTGAVRADDHSSFGKDFDLIVYPKLSVSYVVSEEPAAKRFLESARINSLKLRSAWGQAGRAPSAYSATQTYTVDRVTLGGALGSALRPFIYGNPNLKPEKGEEIELGFDLGAFKERIGADFTYYNKTTTDILQSISIPASVGFPGSQLSNLGTVNNRGIELSIFGTPVRASSFAWDTRFNISTNRNLLESFQVEGKILETFGGQSYGSVQQHRVGYPLGGFWVTPPQRDANGVALLTPTGAAIFNAGDTARRYMGRSTPNREMSFSNTVTLFRVIRLYALLDRKTGFSVYNQPERSRCQAANDSCARVNDPRARFPQNAADSVLFKEVATLRSTGGASAGVHPDFIQKGDFTKLREVSLTLDVPSNLVRRSGAQSASLVFSGRNLALWSDYEGPDPEVNSYGGRTFARADAYALPMTRRFTASINLSF